MGGQSACAFPPCVMGWTSTSDDTLVSSVLPLAGGVKHLGALILRLLSSLYRATVYPGRMSSTGNDDSFDNHTPSPLHQKGQSTAMRHQSLTKQKPLCPHSLFSTFLDAAASCTHVHVTCILQGDDLEDWDVRDLSFQQSQRRPFTHSNRTHSVSGAAFTPESTVFLTTSMEATWVYVPFPETPALGGDFVKGMSNQLDSVVEHYYGSRSRYCDDTLDLGPHFPNFCNHTLAQLWRSINRFESDLDAIKKSVTVFVSNTGKEPLSRKRRWLATAIAAAATSTIFKPVIRWDVRCFPQLGTVKTDLPKRSKTFTSR